MNIQHNMSAATASRHLTANQKGFQISTQRLSSGYRINTAADDAAGLTISEKMRWQIRGLNRASNNIEDGISLTQVADGALHEVHSMLQRMVELTVQAANDTNTEEDRIALQREINQIKEEINRISTDTEYNTIKIFKPTSIPRLSKNPTDILVYHTKRPGGTDQNIWEGGIIYKGTRYAYEDMGLNFDAKGNIVAGTYPVEVTAHDGNPITIQLMFDGNSRIPSGRQYELVPDKNGVSIDRMNHSWKDIKNAADENICIKELNNKGGEYFFYHAGMRVAFDVDEGADLETIISSLKKDGLDTYELRSQHITEPLNPVNPILDMKINPSSVNYVTAVPANVDYLPKVTDQNNKAKYQIKADHNTIRLVIPAAYNKGTEQTIETWQWEMKDPNLPTIQPPLPDSIWGNLGGVNPSSTVVKEAERDYSLTDAKIYSTINFHVDSEASKEELIEAMNAWEITVTMNTSMDFSCDTSNPPLKNNMTVSVTGPASWSLYGKQLEMGLIDGQSRPVQNELVGTRNTDPTAPMTITVQDKKQQNHIFTSTTTRDALETQIIQNFDLEKKIRDVADSLLNNSRIPYINFVNDQSFREGSDQITFSVQENITNWFTRDMFTEKRDSVTNKITGYEFKPEKKAELEAKRDELAKRAADAVFNTPVNITPTLSPNGQGPVTATTKIETTTEIKNDRYSSISTPSDRELKIQSSARGGDYIAIRLCAMDTGILNVESVNVTSHDSASASLDQIYGAIDRVSEMRTGFGVTQNRLEYAMSVDDIMAENVQASESLLRDADMAKESISNALHNILIQSGQSVLAQANQAPQDVLKLFS